MEEYIDKYDSFKKKIVYDFQLGAGGIGDCIKYFMYILNICIKNNIRLYYKKNNILIEKYLLLKYNKMYINRNDIDRCESILLRNFEHINEDIYCIMNPGACYDSCYHWTPMLPIKEVFSFSDEVLLNSRNLLSENITNYISIHLRLGDKHLETDKSFLLAWNDSRNYNEERLFKFIENNSDKNIIFFCDNNSYKLKIKNLYNNIIITSCDIGHTSLLNTTESQVLNSITEFYLMTKSEKIYGASESGFSITASKFHNIPFEFI
jgi:hypothetical protein